MGNTAVVLGNLVLEDKVVTEGVSGEIGDQPMVLVGGKPPMVKLSRARHSQSRYRRHGSDGESLERALADISKGQGKHLGPLPPSRDEAGSSRERCQAELEVPDKQPGPQVVGHVFGACCDPLDL